MYHVCMGSLHQVSPASERHLMTLQTGQYAPAKILRYDPWAECNFAEVSRTGAAGALYIRKRI